MKTPDTVWTNARIATMADRAAAYGVVDTGAVAVTGDRISWVGPVAALKENVALGDAAVIDCGGKLVTPGLVDCHTHLVHAGNRAHEFEMRLNGASYTDIASAGGGIKATVDATRTASEDELYLQSARRLGCLMADGVTTVEIKSGYGLDTENELKMLRAARRLGADHDIEVRTTFLGAHALPSEYGGRGDEYIDLVCDEMLPAVADAGLADAVDAFCETIAFTPRQVERVFTAAARLGIPVKLHAEQLSNSHGAALAARYDALSADHLEYLDANDVVVLARQGTIAVLLPGAFYTLRETQKPPVALLRKHRVPMALATDCNPGSSPLVSLLLIMNMACTLFDLTPQEALAGVTRNAARALGIWRQTGSIEVGKRADMVLWDAVEAAELSYRVGDHVCIRTLVGGQPR